MLQKFSIRSKLNLILFIPLFAVVLLCLGLINDLNSKRKNLEESKDSILVTKALAAVIHPMQIERGLSVGFVTSKGESGGEALEKTRADVDSAILNLKNIFANKQEYQTIIENLDGLDSTRDNVRKVNIEPPKVAKYYTKVISSILGYLLKIPPKTENMKIRNEIQAYIHLATMKESLGVIRATLNSAFINNAFWNDPKMLDTFLFS